MPPLLIQSSSLFLAASQRAFAARFRDALPAKFKRRIKPNSETVISGNQFAISLHGPGAPSQRNHASETFFKNVAQPARFDLAKRSFALLFDNVFGCSSPAGRDELVQIYSAALQNSRQRLGHSGLARAHKANDDD